MKQPPMQQGGCHSGLSAGTAHAMFMCCASLLLLLLSLPLGAQADDSVAVTRPCPGRPRCVQLVVDGTVATVPPLFRESIKNTSINEIVLAGSRYVLRPSSWAMYNKQQPYRLARNLTVRGLQVRMTQAQRTHSITPLSCHRRSSKRNIRQCAGGGGGVASRACALQCSACCTHVFAMALPLSIQCGRLAFISAVA